MQRKHESLRRNPGISRLLVLQPDGSWKPPGRGKIFRAIRQVAHQENARSRETKYFFTLAEAQAFRRGETQTVEAKKQVRPLGFTFANLVEKWKLQSLVHCEPSTQARSLSYLKHLEFFTDHPVDSIGPSQIDEWLAFVKSENYLAASNRTRRNYNHEMAILRGILRFYQERLNPDFQMPIRRDHRRKLAVKNERVLTKDLSRSEYERFLICLESICEESNDPEIPLLARMQYLTATRVQETAALRVDDFDFNSKKLFIRRRVMWIRKRGAESIVRDGTKSGSGKVLQLGRSLIEHLARTKLRLNVRDGFLFFRDGKPLSYRQIEYRYSRAFTKAGINQSGTHILRHAALSEVQSSCKDLRVTMEIAGHRDIKSTVRYAKARESAVASALEALGTSEGVSQCVADATELAQGKG